MFIKITSHVKFKQGLVKIKDAEEYVPLSAGFDGTDDYLTLGGGLTGAADSSLNLTSIWFKVDDAGGDGNLMVLGQNSTSSYSVVRNAAGKIEINLENSAATVLWNFTSTESYNSTTNTGWHNLLFAVNLGATPTASVFVDNEVLAGTNNTGPITGTIDYTVADWAIGATTAGANKLTGSLSDFYMTNEFLDVTDAAIRLKFIDTSASPVLEPAFLGVDGSKPTGNVPLMFFTGSLAASIANWQVNAGSGGGFTDNGDIFLGPLPIINGGAVTVNFTEGSLFTWGYDGALTDGLMGISTVQTDASSPVQVGALTNWIAVVGGEKHSLAIKADDTLWAWGYGADGELGNNANGIAASRSSPVQVSGAAAWSSVAAGGRFTLAIRTDGTMWSWGDGNLGALGHGFGGAASAHDKSVPVQIGNLTDWSVVRAGPYHSSALKTDGTLWMWGSNAFGELGQGDTTYRSSPVQVGALTDWAVISCGQFRQVAVKTDGTLWSWGQDSYRGNLGHGVVSTDLNSPVQVGTDVNWSSVIANNRHSTLALKTNGKLYGWGYNKFYTRGILGVGDIVNHSAPVQVGSDTDWAKIGMGGHHSIAIRTDGTLWAWGNGYKGALGNEDAGGGDYILKTTSSPTQIGSDANWAVVGTTGGDFSARSIAIRDTNG